MNPVESQFLKVGSLLKLSTTVVTTRKSVKKPDKKMPTTVATTAKSVKEPDKKKVVHTVKYGESLWKIARSYQVSVDKLSRWNDLQKGKFIRKGQKLTVWLEG
ncbi:MAG: hypothetical protein DRR08_00310 [Candidatus Parabeggiatoa sp. nov. 2]|nr:MAG: hypothetical protein DRR08_00310 [Gammaproteobacteria bacterium]HEC84927.1 LysM domain-containing protein [Thioploca sp.]